MAIMIPKSGPAPFEPESHEDVIYYALRDNLSDEYLVIHNFHMKYHIGKKEKNTQCDFLIFHPQKGFLTMEAKFSQVVQYDSNEQKWYYGRDRIETSPFTQADRAAKELLTYMDFIQVFQNEETKKKCKFVSGVWFHGIERKDIKGRTENSDYSILLDKSDLLPEKIEKSISSLYEKTNFYGVDKIDLNKADSKKVLDAIFHCSVDIFSPYGDIDRKIEFEMLLSEQRMALDFIRNEKVVTITGGAGTGKTVLAIEQAKKLAKEGKNVLFLCYNHRLREKIRTELKEYEERIKIHNIDSFTEWLCGRDNDYNQASTIIESKYGEIFSHENFSCEYVIIDEAQDYGRKDIEASKLLENLQNVIVDGSEDGSFCAFYDKLQYVNDKQISLPPIIENSLCRIPLKTNCRNTKEIFNFSLRPFLLKKKIKPYTATIRETVSGVTPCITFLENKDNLKTQLDKIINDLKRDYGLQPSNIVILTSKTVEQSAIKGNCVGKKDNTGYTDYYYNGSLFTTCAKFKGMEADSVILLDIDKNNFSTEAGMNNLYVGITRARLYLNIITNISADDATEILTNQFTINKDDLHEDSRLILSNKLQVTPCEEE